MPKPGVGTAIALRCVTAGQGVETAGYLLALPCCAIKSEETLRRDVLVRLDVAVLQVVIDPELVGDARSLLAGLCRLHPLNGVML